LKEGISSRQTSAIQRASFLKIQELQELTNNLKHGKEKYVKESMRNRKEFKTDEQYRGTIDSARIDMTNKDQKIQEIKNKI